MINPCQPPNHVANIVSHPGEGRGWSLSISPRLGLEGLLLPRVLSISPRLGLEGLLLPRVNILACTTTQNGITVCNQVWISKFTQSLFKSCLFRLLIQGQFFQQVCGSPCSLSRPWHL